MRKRTAQKIAENKSLQAKKSRKQRKDRGQKRANYNAKSRENLKPYPKGVSGNPTGRPGTDVAARIARRIFELNEEEIYEGMGVGLLNGGAYDFSVLADRAYGKTANKHEISGPDGEAIALKVSIVRPTLKDMNPKK
jgi:hypothetical protein